MIHQCENFQPQNLYILICEKREIWPDFKILRLRTVHRFRSADFSFFPRTEYREFLIENFHSGGSQYYLRP